MSTKSDAQLLAIAHAIAEPDHPIKQDVATWAAESLGQHDRVEADNTSHFAANDWRRCADRGLLRLTTPTEFGGTGADIATVLLSLEGLGYGCRDNGLAFALASQMLSTQETLVRFGSAAQREQWLTPLMTGDALGAFAMTEPDAGSDAYQLSVLATDDSNSDSCSYAVLRGEHWSLGLVCSA
jgi:alkylation response protein AidB-like acyl-CoA dehydrogenase